MTERSTSAMKRMRNNIKPSIAPEMASTPRKECAVTATAPVSAATYNRNQRTARYSTILRMLCRFFDGSSRSMASAILRSSNCASRWTERGISNAGEPSRPTSRRTGPSIGIMTFVANRQFSPARAPIGKVMLFPRKLRPAISTRREAEGGVRVVGVHHVQAVRRHGSCSHGVQERRLVAQRGAEVRSCLLHLAQVPAEGLQVVHDVGAVAEDILVHAEVREPGNRPVDRKVPAVERIHHIRFEEAVQHPRNARGRRRGR